MEWRDLDIIQNNNKDHLFFYFLLKKMVNKNNQIGIDKNTLIKAFSKPMQIAKELKISNQRVYYWKRNPIKSIK